MEGSADRPFVAYEVIGSMNESGLGPVAWWGDADNIPPDEEPESEEDIAPMPV